MTLFVVVGNREEGDEYISMQGDKHGVYIVSSPFALKGKIIRVNDKVMFYGTALMRKDIEHILREIECCRARGKHS